MSSRSRRRASERREAEPQAGPGPLPGLGSTLPALNRPAGPPVLGGDQLAGLLRVQAEILQRMDARQERLESAVTDGRRSEMMINSTRALNESFQGMRKVQERLVDRIDDQEQRPRRTWLWVLIGIVVLGGAVLGGFLLVGNRLQETGREIAESGSSEAGRRAGAALAALGERLDRVEEIDRHALQRELEDLRAAVDELARDRDRIRTERDGAFEELGASKARSTAFEQKIAALEERVGSLLADNSRLVEQGMAERNLLQELNKAMERMRGAGPGDLTEVAASDVDPHIPGGTTSGIAQPTEDGVRPAGAPEVTERPVPDAILDEVNRMLSNHRGSDQYRLTRVRAQQGRELLGVLLEVRGPDGVLMKTIEAEAMGIAVAARGDLIELEFERGSVHYNQGTRTIRSPFFDGRYQIVVLGVDRQAWLGAGYPFIRTP